MDDDCGSSSCDSQSISNSGIDQNDKSNSKNETCNPDDEILEPGKFNF